MSPLEIATMWRQLPQRPRECVTRHVNQPTPVIRVGRAGWAVMTLADRVPADPDPDSLFDAFAEWAGEQGLDLYPAQTEALIELVSGSNVVLATPTGSGKSLVATGALYAALAQGRRGVWTAPIKALVSEKFFALCEAFGPENVGMLTGDA